MSDMTMLEMLEEGLKVGDSVEVRCLGAGEWLCGVSFWEGGGVTSRGQASLTAAVTTALTLAIDARMGPE